MAVNATASRLRWVFQETILLLTHLVAHTGQSLFILIIFFFFFKSCFKLHSLCHFFVFLRQLFWEVQVWLKSSYLIQDFVIGWWGWASCQTILVSLIWHRPPLVFSQDECPSTKMSLCLISTCRAIRLSCYSVWPLQLPALRHTLQLYNED